MPPTARPLSSQSLCWVISDGRRGIENQALGLAEALQRLMPMDIKLQTLSPSIAFKPLTAQLQYALKNTPEKHNLSAPYPALAIGCGRQAIAPLKALKKQCGDSIFTIYVQNPRTVFDAFDLIVAPEHDRISAPNIISMIGSPNRVTNDRLVVETLKFSETLQQLSTPRAALLIGGNSKTHTLTPSIHAQHIETVEKLLTKNYSLMITTSRRTPTFVKEDYQRLAKKNANIWYFDGNGTNPYFAFLGGADIILATEDSTNMLTESCTTGKPVYTLPMVLKRTRAQNKPSQNKFSVLIDQLKTKCFVVPFDGKMTNPQYAPLRETARVAQEIFNRYQQASE
jgi:mitochondrial fission protein ELM1